MMLQDKDRLFVAKEQEFETKKGQFIEEQRKFDEQSKAFKIREQDFLESQRQLEEKVAALSKQITEERTGRLRAE